jgi:copper chaperone CopZ
MEQIEIRVDGMTCSHCEKTVVDRLSQVSGIGDVTADAATGRVGFLRLEPVHLQSIEDAVTEAGFTLRVWPDRNS